MSSTVGEFEKKCWQHNTTCTWLGSVIRMFIMEVDCSHNHCLWRSSPACFNNGPGLFFVGLPDVSVRPKCFKAAATTRP